MNDNFAVGIMISITMLLIASICLYCTDHWIGGSILMVPCAILTSGLSKKS